MPSTYSPNLRIELIASGEQGNTWGGTTNNNLGTLIENAISGTVFIDSMPSNTYTLTVLNGANDNARNMYIKVSNSTTLTAAGTIIAPAVSKMYVITNSSLGGFAVTLKTSASTGISIPNGATRTVFYDGTDFVDTVTATKSLLLNADATQNLQATTKQQMDAGLALKLSLVGGTGNTMGGQLYLQNTGDPGADQCAIPRGYATSTFLPKVSPTVTSGPLTLSADTPVGAQATSRNFTDLTYVAKSGSTMTGALTLYPTLPTADWMAAPKKYVDGVSVTSTNVGITITPAPITPGVSPSLTVTLNPATTTAIGGVKQGSGCTIASDGTLNINATATGIQSVVGTSPINAQTVGSAVTLSMAANAYYPYSSATFVPTTGTGATGTWGISVSGNAATASAPSGSGTFVTSVNIGSQSVNYASSAGSAANAGDASNLGGFSAASYLLKSGGTMTGALTINQSASQLAFAAFGNNTNWIASATGSAVSDTSFIALTLNNNTGTYKGVLSSGHTGSANDWPLVFSAGSALRVEISTAGNMYPYTDNSISCGQSGNRWSSIWAANGTIQTSDATQKTDITDTDLGLDFITALRPVSYKWKVGQNIVQVPDNLTEASDGCKDHPVVARPGVRTHYGLIAQEVKTILGDKDFGGYIDEGYADGVEGEKGLRYDQFISPLIKAIQELNAKVEALTAEVNTLKGA